MKKIILFLSAIVLFSQQALAGKSCFLATENTNILQQEGDCQTRYSPASTFKVALSLMGYDAGILVDETHPLFPFKEGYEVFINVHMGPHDPRTWMRDSCVWYSQELTKKMGMKRFKNYIEVFNYGNKDISGDQGQNNGLTHSWLSSSLEISPKEQTMFLQKLLNSQLPIDKKSGELTKNIMFIQELLGGWKLYGKTGTGEQLSLDRTKKLDLSHGWFIGWIEKGERKIVFATHLVDDEKQNISAGFRARNEAFIKLSYLIDKLESA